MGKRVTTPIQVSMLMFLILLPHGFVHPDTQSEPDMGHEAIDKILDEYIVLVHNVHGSPQHVSDSLTDWATQQISTNQCHFSVMDHFELGQYLFLLVNACSDAVLALRLHKYVTHVEMNWILGQTAPQDGGSEKCGELIQKGQCSNFT